MYDNGLLVKKSAKNTDVVLLWVNSNNNGEDGSYVWWHTYLGKASSNTTVWALLEPWLIRFLPEGSLTLHSHQWLQSNSRRMAKKHCECTRPLITKDSPQFFLQGERALFYRTISQNPESAAKHRGLELVLLPYLDFGVLPLNFYFMGVTGHGNG